MANNSGVKALHFGANPTTSQPSQPEGNTTESHDLTEENLQEMYTSSVLTYIFASLTCKDIYDELRDLLDKYEETNGGLSQGELSQLRSEIIDSVAALDTMKNSIQDCILLCQHVEGFDKEMLTSTAAFVNDAVKTHKNYLNSEATLVELQEKCGVALGAVLYTAVELGTMLFDTSDTDISIDLERISKEIETFEAFCEIADIDSSNFNILEAYDMPDLYETFLNELDKKGNIYKNYSTDFVKYHNIEIDDDPYAENCDDGSYEDDDIPIDTLDLDDIEIV